MASFRATFTTEQNLNAQFGDNGLNLRTGFGDVIEAPGRVRYDIEQELTEEEQARARQNIGALGEGEGGTDAALFVAEATFKGRTAPVTFTFNKSSRELYEALESADARLKGLAGVFYANVDGQRYAVPATLSEAAVILGRVYLGAIIFAPNATPLGFAVTLSDDPMTVEVPVSILKSVFDYNADVDQLVRTEAQSLNSVQKTQARQNIGAGTYSKPTTGIPEADLANAVKNKINNAATSAALTEHTGNADIHVTSADKAAWGAKYDKPATGIPDTDLADKYAGAAVAGGTADRAASIPFGHVDSTSTATVFTATAAGITELRNGVCVMLVNGVITSASGWTLNVNGLGAKPVYQTMAAASRSTTIFNIAYTMLFVYNETRVAGGCWDIYYGYNSNDNTIAYNVRPNNTAGLMNSQLYRYEIMFSLPDGTLEPANNVSNKPTTYTKTLTTESFNPFEPIYYYSTTTAVAAGVAPGASYCWTQYSGVDLRYSFNEGSTLTAYKATYLRCTPQGDCLVKLDGNDCLVQALPSTEDGKVYIYLGKTYSTSQIWLSQNHPIYEYKGGKLKLWDGTV